MMRKAIIYLIISFMLADTAIPVARTTGNTRKA